MLAELDTEVALNRLDQLDDAEGVDRADIEVVGFAAQLELALSEPAYEPCLSPEQLQSSALERRPRP